MSNGPSVCSTAARCWILSWSSRFDMQVCERNHFPRGRRFVLSPKIHCTRCADSPTKLWADVQSFGVRADSVVVVLAQVAAYRGGVVEGRAVVGFQVQSLLTHLGRIENTRVAGQCIVRRKIRLRGEEIREVGGGCVVLVEIRQAEDQIESLQDTGHA